MLKLFYKTLLISFLSCSLMMMDFNSKGLTFHSAQAETVKFDKIEDPDMMATLTMAGVGLLTSRLYSCKMTTDMMVAAAGGAAFIGGEILSTFMLKEAMKEMALQMELDKDRNLNKEQIEKFKQLRETYVKAKKTAGQKKMLQQAAAAAFLAAAAVAYSLDGAQKASEATCQGSITAAGPSCTSEAAAYAAAYNYGQSAQSAAGGAGMLGSLAATLKGWLSQLVPAPSAAKDAEVKATDAANSAAQQTASSQCQSARAASASCKQTIVVKENGKGVCMTPPGIVSVPKAFGTIRYVNMTPAKQPNTFAEIFQSVFMSSAHADLFTPLGITSSLAVAFLLETSTTLGLKIDTYLYSPMNRAIIWGVLAGLSFAASSSTDNVIQKIDSYIAKIDAILNVMNSMAQGTTTTQASLQTPAIQTTLRPNANIQFNAADYEAVDLTKGNNGGALPCFTGPSDKPCKSFEEANKNLPSFAGLNTESQKQINGILSAANGYNGTSKISSGTIAGTASLANSANALRATVDAAKKKANESLKASGSKLTIEGESKKFSDEMEKVVKDALLKRNTNANDMASNLYGGKGSKSGSLSSTTDDAAKKAAEAAAAAAAAKKGTAAVGNVVDISAPGAAATDVGLTGLDTGTKELSAEELAKLNADQKAVAGKSIEDYDLKNDISKDTSSSIFELISNRYQQSGYPRLFKIKEPKVETPVKK